MESKWAPAVTVTTFRPFLALRRNPESPIFDAYSMHVEKYTRRTLGLYTDICRAFAGVCAALYSSPQAVWYNLPLRDFSQALLWTPSIGGNSRDLTLVGTVIRPLRRGRRAPNVTIRYSARCTKSTDFFDSAFASGSLTANPSLSWSYADCPIECPSREWLGSLVAWTRVMGEGGHLVRYR